MPELPEVETIKNQLQREIAGKTIKSVEIRFTKLVKEPAAKFKKAVEGVKIKKIWRRAKIIGFNLSNEYSIVMHLKLTGQLIFEKKSLKQSSESKHTHLIYYFTDGSKLFFNDLRKFGYVKLVKTEDLPKLFKKEKLGPEPLEKNFTFQKLKKLFSKKPKAKIKPALMDQTFIAGIGNIYSDEILFFAGVHPLRKIGTLKDDKIKKIYQGIKKILPEAIKYQGSSIDMYLNAYGQEGKFVPKLKVYQKEGEKCIKCSSTIKRIKIGARSAHFCPKCQK